MNGKIKLLLVEDNEDERFFLKEGFLQSGLYDIVGEAENGDAMLHFLRNPAAVLPDLILSDLNMPGRNGYEVIIDIKSNHAFQHIPVIILTTAPEVPFAERCKRLGACAYYTKPDTFLEYKVFAKKIYQQMRDCLGSSEVACRGIDKLKHSIMQQLLSTFLNTQYKLG